MTSPPISRRALLLAPVVAAGCGPRKATGFPGYCFVANRGGRSVAAVDLTRFRVRTQIRLDASPSEVLAHPDPAVPRAYVLTPDTGGVREIDAAGLAVSRAARAANRAVAMQFAPEKDALWILCADPASLVRVPLDTFRPARRIPLRAAPDSFDLSSDGRAAVASRRERVVAFVALARGAVERTVACGSEPSLIRFRWDGRQLLAGSAPERSLTVVDAATGKIVVRLPLSLAPRNFCFNTDGGQLFITGDGMDAVVIAFPYTTEIDQTVLAGHAPGDMTVSDTSPSYLLVANPQSNAITALDVDRRKLVAMVQVGQSPGAIRVTPDRQYALVLNETSGDMAVIRLSTFTEAWVRRYKSASLFTMIPVGERPVSAAVVKV